MIECIECPVREICFKPNSDGKLEKEESGGIRGLNGLAATLFQEIGACVLRNRSGCVMERGVVEVISDMLTREAIKERV